MILSHKFNATLPAVLGAVFGILLNGVVAHPVDSDAVSVVTNEARAPQNARIEKFGDPEQEYTVVPLPSGEQGSTSETLTIVGGFKGKPAILKVVSLQSGVDTEKEVDYSDRVDLLLYDEVDDEDEPEDTRKHYIVLKDVRKNFPKPQSPPLKPFHEWYRLNPNMNVQEALDKMYKTVVRSLLDFATDLSLLYYDFHLENFFVDEKFEYVMPVDWAPPKNSDKPNEKLAGVIDITDESGSESGSDDESDSDDEGANDQIKIYEGQLATVLKKEFTVKALDVLLQRTKGVEE